MEGIVFDIVLCAILYGIMLLVIFINNARRNNKNDTDSDDDGGLPVSLPPDIDLPPGVCLPDDPRRYQITEPDEIFA